jgi:hypothetical protein
MQAVTVLSLQLICDGVDLTAPVASCLLSKGFICNMAWFVDGLVFFNSLIRWKLH